MRVRLRPPLSYRDPRPAALHRRARGRSAGTGSPRSVRTAFLGEARLAEPLALIRPEVQGGHVAEHQRRHASRGHAGSRRLNVGYDGAATPASFSASNSPSSCAKPMYSISRDPRREDHTIWTAVAPDEVLTLRTYATTRDYEPRPSAQVCRLQPANQQVTALRSSRSRSSDRSQVRGLVPPMSGNGPVAGRVDQW